MEPTGKTIKTGNHTYRELSNEEALQKYGTSFVFVGGTQKSSEKPTNVIPLKTSPKSRKPR
jgi:hypothetical protein